VGYCSIPELIGIDVFGVTHKKIKATGSGFYFMGKGQAYEKLYYSASDDC
jgi:hypothetical protein